ncbi:TolC family protein [Luteibacter rhizovicinus]|uniref:TolC family protein n=1 Tax=Luteibacter rhizovicinus TaxID=242606 RepID=UPI0006581177|nr:TolC family protein [Luteibacter rhizovicinus]KLD66101.1 hypothetical protein Y883_15275 [Luteibacter rhizovicinus DSM 16549]
MDSFKRLRAALVLALVPVMAAATPPSVLTLQTAADRAVAQAPLLQARRAQADSARQEAARAGALPDPQLTFGIDNLATQGPGAFTAGGDDMTMRTVGISQALPSRSKRQAERAMGQAQAVEAGATEVATSVSIRQAAAEAWVGAWGAHQQIAMLRALRTSWNQDIDVATSRLSAASGSAADVLAARMEALDLDNRLDEAAAQEVQARASLARWVDTEADTTLADPPDFSVLPFDETGLLAHVDAQGALLAWPAREDAAAAALSAAQADKRPAWNLGVTYGSRVRGLSDMVSLQVGVSLPLFTRNRQDRGIAARTADLDAVRFEHADARRAQIEAIQRAWSQWEAWGAQVRRHRDVLLPLARDRVALALAAYRGGGDIAPLLSARRDELAHHADYARMQAEYGRAWAVLAYLIPTGADQ